MKPNPNFPENKKTTCVCCNEEKDCIYSRMEHRYVCEECRNKIGKCFKCKICREDCQCH